MPSTHAPIGVMADHFHSKGEWMISYREELGMHVVPLGSGSVPKLVRALRDRHVVCLVCDRDITGDGENGVVGSIPALVPGDDVLA